MLDEKDIPKENKKTCEETKNKWKEEVLHGEVVSEESWTWLRNRIIKKETDGSKRNFTKKYHQV